MMFSENRHPLFGIMLSGVERFTRVVDTGALTRLVRIPMPPDAQFLSDAQVRADAEIQPPFAEFIGMKVTHLSRERVEAELLVREELGNRFGILHGGAIMALAHNLGGTATVANLPDGSTITTIESKTNFFAGIPVGDVA